MKKIFSLSLAAVMLVAALAGCAGKPAGDAGSDLTPEERVDLYKTAIENARNAEDNEYLAIVTDPEDEMAPMLLGLFGLTAEDMAAFAVSGSVMNVQAYGLAAVYPAEGKADAVKTALETYVQNQQKSFENYLPDQYEITKGAKVETLSDGTVLLVLCDGQEEIFTSIKTAIEAGK